MSNVKNESGILNARKGRYKGKEYVFTHRDPKNGKAYGEDIPVGLTYGKWVPSEQVEFID